MAVSGQMALLSYVARQSVTVQEGQTQLKPIPRTGTGKMDPTLKSDHGLNAGLNLQKLKWDQPIPVAQWPPYWHNFNKVSTVNHGMCHLRAC